MDFLNSLNQDKSDKKEPPKTEEGGFMDKLNDFTGGKKEEPPKEEGGFMDKLNSFAGGGQKSEQHEDGLDKTIDFVQEKVFKQGDQSNESAMEQAKDEQISDFIRGKYKETTGQEFFVEDKEKKYGSH